MAHSRIDDLRRRVEADPASIAFAQLAEEYRRAGQTEEAVRVSREGLTRHPGYLSARVTLGRALLDLGQLEDARTELQFVAGEAPENLAAVRGLAEIFHREGDAASALEYFQRALALARHDPELEEIVQQLSRQVGADAGPSNGLSFEEAHQELLSAADRLPLAPAAASAAAPPAPTDAAGSTAPFDFDTLVAVLGTPAASPMVEAVVRGETPEVFELPDLPALVGDPFAALEAELRGETPADVSPAESVPSGSTPDEVADTLDTGWLTQSEVAEGGAEPEWTAPAIHDAVAAELEEALKAPIAAPTESTADAEAASESESQAVPVTVPEASAAWAAPDAFGSEPVAAPEPATVGDWLGSAAPVTVAPSEVPMAEVEPSLAAEGPDVDENAAEDPADSATASETASDAPAAPIPVTAPVDASSGRRRDGDDVLGDLEDWLNTLQDRSEP